MYQILKYGKHYHELGAQYMQEKIIDKRKKYLKEELNKLGFEVSLQKKPVVVLTQ